MHRWVLFAKTNGCYSLPIAVKSGKVGEPFFCGGEIIAINWSGVKLVFWKHIGNWPNKYIC